MAQFNFEKKIYLHPPLPYFPLFPPISPHFPPIFPLFPFFIRKVVGKLIAGVVGNIWALRYVAQSVWCIFFFACFEAKGISVVCAVAVHAE